MTFKIHRALAEHNFKVGCSVERTKLNVTRKKAYRGIMYTRETKNTIETGTSL